jgi:hypothetical protein
MQRVSYFWDLYPVIIGSSISGRGEMAEKKKDVDWDEDS